MKSHIQKSPELPSSNIRLSCSFNPGSKDRVPDKSNRPSNNAEIVPDTSTLNVVCGESQQRSCGLVKRFSRGGRGCSFGSPEILSLLLRRNPTPRVTMEGRIEGAT
ncbi:hypothetical protein TNIN_209921 [Trichonephila inaurata madagascariensis]|uniref:Uncharacterized protein n=1 Tax=Trichonephila inaurata madagascariensis TaxID=2747483 RepID=A0A8X6XLV6_9ARAC|nr:hypothetical protein TNIN_368001 [Trichonephila inaurata madagascariensis]GFY69510.1 hypothetical protein TNIN_209921 [Trichonephila inaurata madagascariensis]